MAYTTKEWYDYKNHLAHYGIEGQKWGVRRFQNLDGTLTEEGKKRYLRRKHVIDTVVEDQEIGIRALEYGKKERERDVKYIKNKLSTDEFRGYGRHSSCGTSYLDRDERRRLDTMSPEDVEKVREKLLQALADRSKRDDELIEESRRNIDRFTTLDLEKLSDKEFISELRGYYKKAPNFFMRLLRTPAEIAVDDYEEGRRRPNPHVPKPRSR